MALEDRLHWPRQKVLAVDAQPLDVAPGEVDVPLRVAVAQVAGVEAAATRARRRGLGILVVALEESGAGRVHDLADGLRGIRETAALVEAGRRAWAALLVEDLDARSGEPERAGRVAVGPREGDADLARAVAVDDATAEAAREAVHVLSRRLVAVGQSQRIVGVVGTLRRRHDVGERAADVGEEGAAVSPHVGQESGRREAPAEHQPAAARSR